MRLADPHHSQTTTLALSDRSTTPATSDHSTIRASSCPDDCPSLLAPVDKPRPLPSTHSTHLNSTPRTNRQVMLTCVRPTLPTTLANSALSAMTSRSRPPLTTCLLNPRHETSPDIPSSRRTNRQANPTRGISRHSVSHHLTSPLDHHHTKRQAKFARHWPSHLTCRAFSGRFSPTCHSHSCPSDNSSLVKPHRTTSRATDHSDLTARQARPHPSQGTNQPRTARLQTTCLPYPFLPPPNLIHSFIQSFNHDHQAPH